MDQQENSAAADSTDSTPSAPRLTIRRVLHEVAERFLNLESGWLRTVRELTLGPGPMIRRYVQGHRKTYASPVAYLVLATAMSYVVQRLFGFNEIVATTARANTMNSPLQMEFSNQFTELLMQNTLYISFGILVPLALLIRLFFRKSDYNLAESFVFALYAIGHTTLLGCILIPFYVLLPPSATIHGAVSVTVGVVYMVYAARGFFSGGFVFVAIKMTVAYLIAYATFMAMMTVFVLAYVFMVIAPTSSGVPWDLVTAVDYDAAPVVEKLLDDGADVNMTLKRTAMHAAAANGNVEIVELLIEQGADVNLQDIHGRIPLFVAIAEHQPEVAERLAEAQPDVNLRSIDGSTLLMAAVRAENLAMVRWALDHKVDVNAIRTEKIHATALMMAAGMGNPEIVGLLLAGGADPALTNHEDRTALDLAKGKEVKALLRARSKSSPPQDVKGDSN